MEKFFNTAGPNKAEQHYTIPPLARWDLAEIESLIAQERYFLLHAPRQTGKTSCLIALMEHLNRAGRYRALYANIESAQAFREDVDRGLASAVRSISSAGVVRLNDPAIESLANAAIAESGGGALRTFLRRWCAASSQPTVLMLDEVDALVGDTLIALLRQLREGYADRPAHFPHSLILCGVRDLKDYRIHASSEKGIITGGSAFNIKAESLRLGNFSRAELAALYRQHTDATGQRFTDEALALAWELTEGQPWLTNALAREATWKMTENRDRTRTITGDILREAAERIIQSRATHLDQLTDKLQEERVRRVIGPLLANAEGALDVPADDVEYVRDLGLIAQERPLRIANQIYREVIPRELTWTTQESLTQQTPWYVRPDGRLDVPKLLAAFQQFFRENGEAWLERFRYREAGPQLLLQAFLQRVVNGGGRLEREYGLGRKRTDLLIVWPIRPAAEVSGSGFRIPSSVQRVVIEVKVVKSLGAEMFAEALAQTGEYLDKSGAEEGHLFVFDRRPERTWEEKLWHRDERDPRGRSITVWGA